MLVNKTVEFFLSEVARRGRAGSGLGARCRRAGIGWQPDVTAANRCWVEADAGGAEAWQAASSEQDADGCRGWAGSGTSRDRGRRQPNHRGWRRARSEMPVVPRLGSERNLQGPGRRQPNQLKRKRSIISSSNSGFSKSFSLVMIRLLCSQNPASW